MKPVSKNDLFVVLKKLLAYEEKEEVIKENKLKNINAFSRIIEKYKNKELPEDLMEWVFKQYDECKRLIKQLPVDEVENFANSIANIAKEYNQKELSIYALLLKKSAQTFDISTLLKLLPAYLDLIETLKKTR